MFVLPIWPRQPSIRAKTPKHHTEFGKTPSTIKIKQKKKKLPQEGRVGSVRRARHGSCGRTKWRDVPFGQVFHTSSFTRPTVVSGSNAIDLRRPETSRNCISVCGTCGTTTATAAPISPSPFRGCTPSCGGAPASAPPPPRGPSSGTAPPSSSSPSSGWPGLSPAADPGRVPWSTRVNEVRVLAGSAAISTGMDLAIVGSEILECEGLLGW